MRKVFSVLIFVLAVFTPSVSYAAPICGKTYPIVEPDLLTEIHNQAEKLLHNKEQLARIREELRDQLEHYAPVYLSEAYLPPSDKTFQYLHDVVYTLPFNIPKVVKGRVVGILYPKGYTFHVLRYIPYKFPTLVVFDIRNRLQREYVIRKYGRDYNCMFITVDGDLSDVIRLIRKLKRPVYFNLPQINERFALRNTISVVRRSKKYVDDVEVHVIGMDEIKEYLSHKKLNTSAPIYMRTDGKEGNP